MRKISGQNFRNAIAILNHMNDTDRPKVEAIAGKVSDKQWGKFINSPARGFLTGDDAFQNAVVTIINERLEEC